MCSCLYQMMYSCIYIYVCDDVIMHALRWCTHAYITLCFVAYVTCCIDACIRWRIHTYISCCIHIYTYIHVYEWTHKLFVYDQLRRECHWHVGFTHCLGMVYVIILTMACVQAFVCVMCSPQFCDIRSVWFVLCAVLWMPRGVVLLDRALHRPKYSPYERGALG